MYGYLLINLLVNKIIIDHLLSIHPILSNSSEDVQHFK